MAWNEPGGGKQRDPWRDNGGGSGPSPDFDALIKRARDFFNRLLVAVAVVAASAWPWSAC